MVRARKKSLNHRALYAEAILTQDPHVHACLMFGRGRFQNGVLIQPKEQFDPNDEVKLEEFRNKIWYVLRYESSLAIPTDGSFPPAVPEGPRLRKSTTMPLRTRASSRR